MLKPTNLMIHLAFVHSKILKQVDNGLSVHGISFSEFLIMHHLNNGVDKTMKRINLAERIGVTASGVTRLLNPMEKRRLVQKETNPRDARVSLVKLTTAGERVLTEATISFEQTAASILQPLDDQQQSILAELIGKLNRSQELIGI